MDHTTRKKLQKIKRSNAHVVLGDGDTYSGEMGACVVFLNKRGQKELDTGNSMSDVSKKGTIHEISITELIDCWIKHNL